MPLKIGIAGARGVSTIQGFQAIEGAEVAAVCDLNEDVLNRIADTYHISKRYRIFEDMLLSDIDAVVISTPMQCHVPQAIAALHAGKHVLSEVTAGVTMDELWWLAESVEKSGKVYMFAENELYFPHVQLVTELCRRGMFGETYFAEGEYTHDISRIMTYSDGRPSWRRYWQYGKRGAFYPTHSLGPVMRWFGGARIEEISCHTARWFNHTQYRQDDVSLLCCGLDDGKLVQIRVDCKSPRPIENDYFSLQGTKGCFEAGRGMDGRDKIWLADRDPEKRYGWQPLRDFEEYLPERYRSATEQQKNAGHSGSDFFIVSDFYEAATGKIPSPVDVYDACEWTAAGLLSELSAMNNGRAMRMPDFRKTADHSQKIIEI